MIQVDYEYNSVLTYTHFIISLFSEALNGVVKPLIQWFFFCPNFIKILNTYRDLMFYQDLVWLEFFGTSIALSMHIEWQSAHYCQILVGCRFPKRYSSACSFVCRCFYAALSCMYIQKYLGRKLAITRSTRKLLQNLKESFFVEQFYILARILQ